MRMQRPAWVVEKRPPASVLRKPSIRAAAVWYRLEPNKTHNSAAGERHLSIALVAYLDHNARLLASSYLDASSTGHTLKFPSYPSQ